MFAVMLAIARKDLTLLVRDPGALVVLFLMPLIFILVMSLALSGLYSPRGSAVVIAVVDQDGGPFSAVFVRSLAGSGGFDVLVDGPNGKLDRAAAEKLIVAGKAQVALIIPAGIGEAVQAKMTGTGAASADIVLVSDPALSPQVLAPVRGAVQSLAEQAAFRFAAPAGIDALFAQIETRGVSVPPGLADAVKQQMGAGTSQAGSPVAIKEALPAGIRRERRPNAVEQNVPAYTLFGLFFIATRLASNIIDEKQLGTFRRLLAAPVGRATLLAGKLLAFILVNLVQVAVLFAVGVLVLPHIGLPPMTLGAHPENLILVSLAVSLAATSFGLFLAAVARTEAQANGLGLILILVSSMLGGVMVPSFVMPGFMQRIGLISPHTWGLQAYQDVLMRDAGLTTILPELGILLLFAAGFFSVAVWRFRWN
jgi:ABC-2 type transport system permease protein